MKRSRNQADLYAAMIGAALSAPLFLLAIAAIFGAVNETGPEAEGFYVLSAFNAVLGGGCSYMALTCWRDWRGEGDQ